MMQLSKEDIYAALLRRYPAYTSKQLNVSDLARVCDISLSHSLQIHWPFEKNLTKVYFCYIIFMLHLEHKYNIFEVFEMTNESFSEKVSVNINTSTLSSIDLLVDNGYYSNRSDFINQALREGLQKHQNTLDRIIDKKMESNDESPNHWFIGVYGLEKQDIDMAKKRGREMEIKGYGVLAIDEHIDEETLFEVVRTIKVKGKVVCKKSIKEHYGLK